MNLSFKIATATMSREISQINDYDGVSKIELRFENGELRSSGFAAEAGAVKK